MYWEKELEVLDRKNLEKLQAERLMKTLRQAVNSPYYGRIPEINHAIKSGITSIEQIRELPFTTKEDLRKDFPWGFLSTDKREVVRLHSSSGTTGNPVSYTHLRAHETRHDLVC